MSARSIYLKSPERKNGAEYLQEVLGDILAQALSSVARERPKDPVQYVAEFLRNIVDKQEQKRIKKKDNGGHNRSSDSGHYDDQEAPSNNSSSTLSTLDLKEEDKFAEDRGRRRYDEDRYEDRGRRNYSRNDSKDRYEDRGRRNYSRNDSRHSYYRNHTSSSSDNNRSPRSLDRGKHRNRSRRRKTTADSEPLPSVVSTSSVTYGKDVYTDQRRTRSLTDNQRPYNKNDPRRFYSKRVPVAALPWEEYRIKRGLKLPPMKSTPEVDADYDSRNGTSIEIDGKSKPKQLKPLNNGDSYDKNRRNSNKYDYRSETDNFDWQKHSRKNDRMIRENKIISNYV